jgi:signal transduction histidine kinase
VVVEPQPTSLSDAVADAVNTVQWAATAKTIGLSIDVAPNLPLIYADPSRIRQILVILTENAIKFTPAYGTVKLQARMLDRKSGALLLEVVESGCGIPLNSIDGIFERLFQEDLVIRQGGEIRATSSPGQGAVFSVTLPIFSTLHSC